MYTFRNMGRSFTNVIIHIIFHIKNAEVAMKEEDLTQIFSYIGGIIRASSGFAYTIGGRPDHIHILTSLPINICISDFVRIIKANTSKWIKTLNTEYKNFSWQEGYGAFSVSASKKQAVIDYIHHQKEHHQKCSARTEFIHFLEKHGLPTDYIPV